MNLSRVKNISIHLLFWGINYSLVFYDNLSWNGFTQENNLLPISYSYGLLFNALLFYAQAIWLVPKYFTKNKKGRFWLLTIGFLLLVTFIEATIDTILGRSFDLNENDNFYKNPFIVITFVWLYSNLIFHVLYVFAGFFFGFKAEYRKAEREKQELLKETMETELKYLKAQLNPHFLFNGINSVYHLIGKDDTLAKDTLLQFSGLLRYQLYESNATHIVLEKELEYVAQYIQLEDIRKGNDITLSHTFNYENEDVKIAPLLLIPFIENAFKHLSNHLDNDKNKITITVKEQNKKLTLIVNNSFDDLQPKKTGGVGLNNVKRRLQLLYPDTYELRITKENYMFKVYLKIDLS